MKYTIGVAGLGVMGFNLALNIERNGFPVVGYDLDPKKSETFQKTAEAGAKMAAASTPADFISALEKPRRILLMVPAGPVVDNAIAHLKPYLEPGDILIDGGNSYFLDTERRYKALAEEEILFMGMGVSGGEQGALWGPSLMPGGLPEAWEAVSPIFTAIAAKADDGEPCAAYIGPGGAGHYVKMVHNGIEYADMQLIAEIYDLLHRGLGLTPIELAEVFDEWNQGELKSYLVEITSHILRRIDQETGKPLVEIILDDAAQKGTGRWASQNAMEIGVPIPSINAAVEGRLLSSFKVERGHASKVLMGPSQNFQGDRQEFIEAARHALYASKIACYAQGMNMLKTASHEYRYGLNLGEIARIWRAGCIIRAALLEDIMSAFKRDPDLSNLLLFEEFRDRVMKFQAAWRFMIKAGVEMGIPVLGLSASLGYFDSYRSERLPANLIQAQRDYFGAHSYRRADRAGSFHTDWQE
jgi:6-phosphogluconate dehydrogenase